MELEKLETNGKKFVEYFTAKRAAVAAIVFASLVGPGFLALYRFRPEHLESWDIAKIVLFCFSVSVPSVLLISLTLGLGTTSEQWNNEGYRQRHSIAAAAVSAIILYATHVHLMFPGLIPNFPVPFLKKSDTGLRLFVGNAIIYQGLFMVMMTVGWLAEKWQAKRKKPPAPPAPEIQAV